MQTGPAGEIQPLLMSSQEAENCPPTGESRGPGDHLSFPAPGLKKLPYSTVRSLLYLQFLVWGWNLLRALGMLGSHLPTEQHSGLLVLETSYGLRLIRNYVAQACS